MHLKLLRGQKDGLLVKIEGLPVQAQGTYDGEENTLQAGFNTATVSNGSAGPSILTGAGSESFDEPLTTQQVVNIANLLLCKAHLIPLQNS
jgi:hypothetical protein